MRSSAEVLDKIIELSKQKEISLSELARRTHMAKSGISLYFNKARTFPLNRVPEFAEALNVTPEELLGVPSNLHMVTELVKIPVIGRIACGDPIFADENIEDYVEMPKENVPSGVLFYLIAQGDSMTPTIPDGSKVLIRRQPEVEDGEIAAVLLTNDNEATLKRVRHDKKSVILIPDNPQYKPIVASKDNPIKILGKAVRYTSEL